MSGDSGSSRVARLRSPEAQAWWEYGGPFVLFGVLTMLEGYVPIRWYPVVYAVKVFAVTASLVWAGAAARDITPSSRGLATSVLIGLAVCAAWVIVDTWVPYPHLGARVGFNPFASLTHPSWAAGVFLAVRFYGLTLVVPVMEELFMRSFLLRYFTNPDVREVPIGAFSTGAFWIVAALSALSHPEWLVAIIASAVYALLLKRTRSLFHAVVAHATTNAALGIYVVLTGNWKFW
ncbi:MAG: protease family protein [Acidobacteriota bacterium]|jgi:CAAX prenyl protease-like protein